MTTNIAIIEVEQEMPKMRHLFEITLVTRNEIHSTHHDLLEIVNIEGLEALQSFHSILVRNFCLDTTEDINAKLL